MSLDIYGYDNKDDEDWNWSMNITHNLGKMADACGIYEYVWGKSKIDKAGDLADKVYDGIKKLTSNPEHYKQFSSSNGWGTYSQFVDWLLELLKNCLKYPDSYLTFSR